MSERIALCASEEVCADASLVGLDGERLEEQAWLSVFSTGEESRGGIAQDEDVSKVWVVSCEDIEPINLAASLKKDRPDLFVTLVDADRGGSILSRAHTAGIDEVVGVAGFVRSYADEKARLSGAGDTAIVANPSRQKDAHADRLPAGCVEQPKESVQADKNPAALVVAARPRAFVFPVVSGSGGAGKSAVAVLSAHIARRMGYRTLLFDYDLQFGDVAMLSGKPECLSIDVALSHPDVLEREIAQCSDLLVLAAPSRLEMAEDLVRDIPWLLDQLEGQFDLIVANTGAAWAEQHALLLERCNAALFLIDQRATSVRACKHALELCSRCGIAAGPFEFAINRCAKGAPLSAIDVSNALRGVPVFELKDGGRDVEDYLSAGSPEELIDSKNEFCASLGQVLAKLLPDGAQRIGASGLVGNESKASRRRGKHASRWLGRGQ